MTVNAKAERVKSLWKTHLLSMHFDRMRKSVCMLKCIFFTVSGIIKEKIMGNKIEQ